MPDDPLETLAAEEEAAKAAEADATAAGADGEGAETEQEKLLAGKYKTAEDLERAYKELEGRFGSQGSELGELRRNVEQLTYAIEAQQQPQPQQYQQQPETLPDGTPIMSPDQVTGMIESGDPGQMLYVQDYLVKLRLAEAEMQREQREAPYREAIQAQQSRSALDQLKVALAPYGGDQLLDKHREVLKQAIERDGDRFSDPATVVDQMRSAILAAEYMDAANGSGQARNALGQFAGNTHVEGGSGAAPDSQRGSKLSPEEQEIADLVNYKSKSDVFGKLPG